MKILLSLLVVFASIIATRAQEPSANRVELTNSYDAFGRAIRGTQQDWGFSTVIKYGGKTILFDAGTNAQKFEANVKALKIDLRKVDIAIVSHGHYDHIGGFDVLFKANPKVKIYAPGDFTSIGAPSRFPFRDRDPDASKLLTPDERYFRGEKGTDNVAVFPSGKFSKYDVEYLTQPKEILPGITVVPTASELIGNFNKYPPFDERPQFSGLPELSLSLSTDGGDIIVTGCSHSGVERIVVAVKQVRAAKVRLVVGGFHLIPYDSTYIDGLVAKLKGDLGVESVAPAHCTGHGGFAAFKAAYGANYRFFGLGETIVLP